MDDYLSFGTENGRKIYYRKEIPAGICAMLIICHGYGEHSGLYRDFSRFLSQNGYGVYTYDHPAHGRSEEERGHIERFETMIDDLADVVKHVKCEHPDSPLYIFGHSMGGLIAFSYGVLHPEDIMGQVFTGPALGMPWGTNLIPVWLFKGLKSFFPKVKVYPMLTRKGSRNREYRLAVRHDPYVLKYATIGFYYEFIRRGIPWAQHNAQRYRLPCLFLHGKDDKIIPCQSSMNICGQIVSGDKTLKLYEGFNHELVQEPERELVWQDILAWLNQRTVG